MNVQVETLPQSQVALAIEVDSTAVGAAIDRAYRNLGQRVNVPGFRKGKAPRAMLEATLGRGAVIEEATDIAVNAAYQQALEQTGLDPLSRPEVELQGEGFDPAQPLHFKATFYVKPPVDLGAYRSIQIAPPKTEVSAESVDEFIMRMALNQTAWAPVEDRPAALGDIAILDLKGTVAGETVIEGESQEHFLDPDQPESSTEIDLRSYVVDMNVGEEKDVEVTLPENFEPASAAGQTTDLHLKLVRLEGRPTPVIDDALAQTFGEFQTVDDVRVAIRGALEAQQRSQDADAYATSVLTTAVEGATVELPPPLVEEEIHRTLDNFREDIENRQHISMDIYLRLVGKTMDELHEEGRAPSESRVKSNLVLEAIAEAETLVVPREPVDAELREMSALPTVRERDRRRVLTSPVVRERVETRLKRRLALQRLLEIALPPLGETDDTEGAPADSAAEDALRQQAVENVADALESPTHESNEEEI